MFYSRNFFVSELGLNKKLKENSKFQRVGVFFKKDSDFPDLTVWLGRQVLIQIITLINCKIATVKSAVKRGKIWWHKHL